MASRPIVSSRSAPVDNSTSRRRGASSAGDEAALLAQARAGNADAFAGLLGHSGWSAYQLAMKITHNREDAEDAVQAALFKAFLHLGNFQERSRFSTWFGRIAANEALMRLRKRRAGREVSLEEVSESSNTAVLPQEMEDPGERPEESCFRRELQGALARAILGLEPRYRRVFLLRELAELSTLEAAKKLRVSDTAVMSRLRRARLQMRQQLSGLRKAEAA